MGVIKINVDGGAVGAPGLLTGGRVFHYNFGVFRGYFAFTHGTSFAFEAELATTLHAICLAHHKGWKNIWLECDSNYVVQILRSENPIVRWRLLAKWHNVRQLL
ncbi:hypothetical protein ACS0TY_004928 [Phlomoides rotata]